MLSRRGAEVSASGRRNLLWEVMENSYHHATNRSGYVNLGVAENTLMHDELITQMKKTFEPSGSALSYGEGPGGSLRLRSSIASFVNQFFLPVVPARTEHITVSNGVTSSIERCAFELGDPGDYFLLGRPFYSWFPSELGDRAGVHTLAVAFGPIDPFSVEAARRYEEELLNARRQSKNVRALVLCSPHNPLGRCYPRKTLVALMKLCQKYSIHLIVDEIYALSIYRNPEYPDAEPFTSALAINASGIIDPGLVHVLWGLSKDFGANGLRIGCVISQSNPRLVAALDAHAPYSYPSALLDYMASSLLEDHEFVTGYIAENRRRLSENYVFVTGFLQKRGFRFYSGSSAGFFIWVDLGGTLLRRLGAGGQQKQKGSTNGHATCAAQLLEAMEVGCPSALTQQVMDRLVSQRVYLARGDAFGSELPGWFRIVFAQPRQLLCEGLRRMTAAMEL